MEECLLTQKRGYMNFKDRRGLTLIELLVVIAVLGILMGLIVSVGPSALNKANEAKAQSMIASLEIAISMYSADTGVYPGASNTNANLYSDLTSDPGDDAGWAGAYMTFKSEDISGGQIMDPWGDPYNYRIAPTWGNTGSYNIWSNGSDSEDDSAVAGYNDDIYNW